MTMRTVQMLVTRKLAEQFLRKNDINRPFRDTYCEELCGIILRGEWKLTHQGIAISTDGTLLDGQHRLHAIVRTGIPCMMLVTTDCDAHLFELIDRGRIRTQADSLHVSRRHAAAARFLFMLSKAPANWSHSCTIDQVKDVLCWAGAPIDVVLQAVRGVKRVKTASPIVGACIVRVMQGGERASHALRTYQAFATHGEMPRICRSFANQLDRGEVSTRRDGWDLAARAWIAFDHRRADQDRIQIKDKTHSLEEMKEAADRYHAKQQQRVEEAA
jgi:hypothetical protein